MSSSGPRLLTPRAIWAEPVFRFFLLGAALFAAHRWATGDSRLVIVTDAVKAGLARRFQDHKGRAATPAELAREVDQWRRDEALYREALREGLDRNDATIRAVLADRVRARASLLAPRHDPTQAELDAFLAAHRTSYETPRRTDYETITFSRKHPRELAELARFEAVLERGADARMLGRPLVGGNLTGDELAERLGPQLAEQIQRLPVGAWKRIEQADDVLLVRVNAIEGGLPPPDELRKRLSADWTYAREKQIVEEAERAIVARYRFEERH
jgi:hypothetical protein